MIPLIKRAKNIYHNIDMEKLKNHGIERNRKVYEFIVTYPGIAVQQPIKQEDIFSRKETIRKGSNEREVQFYVHIPFCTGICSYCGRFIKYPSQPKKATEEYLDYLGKELSVMKNIPELATMKVASLYIGGGTPFYLSPTQLKKLTDKLVTELDISNGVEFTVEGSPETIKRAKLDILSDNKINRISMGVQSFHDDILRLCNRRHTGDTARKIAKLIMEKKFSKFNIDLIFGLPLHTLESWEEDLKSAVHLGANNITTYPLATNPFSNMAKLDDGLFPDEESSLLMEIMAKEYLRDLGFTEYPVHFFTSNRSQPQVQTIKKWEGLETIGMGVSTYQFMNFTQYHNHFEMEKYKTSIDGGELPVWMGIKLDKQEQMTRSMIFGMKRGKININRFHEQFGVSPEQVFPDIIEILYKDGLICMDDHEIRLSYTGQLFSEEIATKFFSPAIKEKYEKAGAKYAGYVIQ